MFEMYIQIINIYIYIILPTDAKSIDRRSDAKRFRMSLVSKADKSV